MGNQPDSRAKSDWVLADYVMHLHYIGGMKKLWKKLAESTLTDRYQTTIPSHVRAELGLEKRDMIEFLKSEDGHLILRKRQAETLDSEEFPTELLAWLDFLSTDHSKHPNELVRLDDDFFAKAKEMVGHLAVDLDSPLEED